MKSEIKTVTPEMAKELLKNSCKNRPVSKMMVDRYSSDMEKGQWKLTGQGIQISEFGNLIDGQHRLHAIIKADASIPMLIIYEVRESTFDVLDQGVTRTAGHVLNINNVKNGNLVAAMIRAYLPVLRMKSPTLSGSIGGGIRKVHTNADIYKFYQNNQRLCDRAASVAKKGNRDFKLLRPSTIGTIYLLLTHDLYHDQTLVEKFLIGVTTGNNIECNTILLLRQKIINAAASETHKIQAKFLSKLFAIAWNDYITGKNDRKILTAKPDKDSRFI